MVAESAQVVDFQAYREARHKAIAPATVTLPNGARPMMMMWVPVWTFFPIMAGPWANAQ